MKAAQTYSWILLSISYGASKRKEIAHIADGINHAVPTEQEMDSSLRWLLELGLVSETDCQFTLTEGGKALFLEIPSSTLMNTWHALSKVIENSTTER